MRSDPCHSLELKPWIGLSIGNTHCKWGYFEGQHLVQTWSTKTGKKTNQPAPMDWQQWCEYSPVFQWHQEQGRSPFPNLFLASVVASEQQIWQDYPQATRLTLSNLPMASLYEGLGIDRALAVLGAGHDYGWPVLVIDAGTALTYSGADETGFKGGAIAPGIGLQLNILHQNTAALPHIKRPERPPNRWAQTTDEAILSGVILSTVSGIEGFIADWVRQYPSSQVILTGGDGEFLLGVLKKRQTFTDSTKPPYQLDANLILRGIASCRFKGRVQG